MEIKIIGIYPVSAPESCHLVELQVLGDDVDSFDIGAVTQPQEEEPRDNWQVPWDEHVVEETPGSLSVAFFFHCMDIASILETQVGAVPLPAESVRPQRLEFIEYESP